MKNQILVTREGVGLAQSFDKGLVLAIGMEHDELQFLQVGLNEEDLARITAGFLQLLEALQG